MKCCTYRLLVAATVFLLVSCGGGASSDAGLVSSGLNGTGGNAAEQGDSESGTPPPSVAPGSGSGPISPTTPIQSGSLEKTELVAASGEGELIPIQDITEGSIINLSAISAPSLNVTAGTDGGVVGSVGFNLVGPVTVNRVENNPPYTLISDATNLSMANNELPDGQYTLTVTAFSLSDGNGQVLDQNTISFQVVCDASSEVNVPQILAVSLLEQTEETGDLVSRGNIAEGAEIDLAGFLSRTLNIGAVSANSANTGSVRFLLQGPTSIDRVENSAPYTLESDTVNWVVAEGYPQLGNYTLTVIPYELANAQGQTGIPFVITFSVIQSSPTGESISTPQANGDTYVMSGNRPFDGRSVAANDRINADLAIFSIVERTSNGEVLMDVDGGFTYTPNEGFAGSDSFVYQIAEGDQTDTAVVNLRVLSSSGVEGFTTVLPSQDSKIIYVSSSSGSDTNNCLSADTPCRSLAAGFEKVREGYPDHVLLKRGDVWRERLEGRLRSGRNESEPAVLSYYGEEGPRPRLEYVGQFYIGDKYFLRHYSIIGLEFAAINLEFDHPEFTGIYKKNKLWFLGGTENLLIEDNLFTHTELTIQSWDIDNDGVREISTNLKVRRNIFTGLYYESAGTDNSQRPSNMYISGADGVLIEENVLDYGGWTDNPAVPSAIANQYNHNVYMQYGMNGENIIFRKNISVRASSLGVHGRSGGTFEDNFFARNSVGLQMGYNGQPLPVGTPAIARRNVITEGYSMVRGAPEYECIGGFCSRAVWGLRMEEHGGGIYTVQDNIVAGIYDTGEWRKKFDGLVLWGYSGQDRAQTFTNNILWNWTLTPDLSNTEGYSDPGRTLADYNASLGGDRSFDDFMDIVKARPVRTWDDRYTAESINQFIREGYTIE